MHKTDTSTTPTKREYQANTITLYPSSYPTTFTFYSLVKKLVLRQCESCICFGKGHSCPGTLGGKLNSQFKEVRTGQSNGMDDECKGGKDIAKKTPPMNSDRKDTGKSKERQKEVCSKATEQS